MFVLSFNVPDLHIVRLCNILRPVFTTAFKRERGRERMTRRGRIKLPAKQLQFFIIYINHK